MSPSSRSILFQTSIIGGASLWVMGGKKPEEYKGVAKFFTFLSDTNRQAKLHQESGYLPITKAAYEKTKADGFYAKNPVPETPLKELTNKEPTENSRGLRFGNMVQMRDLWAEEIEAALAGPKIGRAFSVIRNWDWWHGQSNRLVCCSYRRAGQPACVQIFEYAT